jgi:hypothetical protein
MYDLVDKRRYDGLKLKLELDAQAWLATDDLITALAANSREPIPPVVLAHLRARLDGTAKKRRGPKTQRNSIKHLRETMVTLDYERHLSWLQKRSRSEGLDGWSCIKDAEWWQGPPNERAARMVQRRWMRHASWRHVLNIVSQANS